MILTAGVHKRASVCERERESECVREREREMAAALKLILLITTVPITPEESAARV